MLKISRLPASLAWGMLLSLHSAGCGDEASPDEASGMDAGTGEAGATAEAGVPVPVVDHGRWRAYDATLDPWSGHQPELIACEEAEGWYIEDAKLEVQTALCNYLLVEHPALVDLEAGTTLEVMLWYLLLTSPEPAQAHVALALGEEVVWETYVDIPHVSDVHTETFTIDSAVPAGTPVRLHLHNHGENSWTFASLKRL